MTVRGSIEIKTPDGVVKASTHHPDGQGPWPAVIFFMDAMGMREALETMAARFADAGYFVMVPNLLYRAGDFKPFDPKVVWTDEGERTRLMNLLASMKDPAPTIRDVGLYLDALGKIPEVKAGKAGAVGYCMGGTLAFRSAAAYPDRLAAAASIHGGNPVTDDPNSPHRKARDISARLYFGCADNDRSCTPEQRAALEQALSAAGVAHEIELYPGKAHGFAVLDTPAYDAAAGEQHVERVLRLFAETLR